MNEGQIVEICKEQNGYSIEVKKPQGGFDTFVAETFNGMVGHVAQAMNLTDEERHPPMIVTEGRHYGKTDRMVRELAETLYPGNARHIKAEPTYDDLRDELGEVRRISERRKEKLDETLTVNARLVRDHTKLEERCALVDKRSDDKSAYITRLEKALMDHGINPSTGKKQPVKKTPSRKR